MKQKLYPFLPRGTFRRSGIEELTGQRPDISEYLDFEFYDLVWFLNRSGEKLGTTGDDRALARWLGVSHRVGSDICYWLLTVAGLVIVCSSVEHVTQED